MSNKYIYMVTYELNLKLLRNYTPLYNAIKGFAPWMHYIDSTWFIVTDKSAKEIYQKLARHVHKDDNLFVTRVTDDYFGQLPKGAWEWIKKHQYNLYRSDYY